jgi:hypothetical protein
MVSEHSLSEFNNEKFISKDSRTAYHDQAVILIFKEVVAQH